MMPCGCSGVEVPAQAPTLANRPDLIKPVALVIAGLVGVGLLAAWFVSGEAFGVRSGHLASKPSGRV